MLFDIIINVTLKQREDEQPHGLHEEAPADRSDDSICIDNWLILAYFRRRDACVVG